jgi:hypothetical protein
MPAEPPVVGWALLVGGPRQSERPVTHISPLLTGSSQVEGVAMGDASVVG